ncbi:MAG: cation diffusion facilitator family transporter [Smithellaceae bacterium]|nr:cation diffusion facilitator family transporter [Smithellaceae bacterium]
MIHEHNHAPHNYNRAFAIGVALNAAFVMVEATFGIMADSLALLADAGHNLSDVMGLLLAWGASILTRRTPSERRTYGLRKSTILAALFNAVILLAAVGGMAWEAVRRFNDPAEVAGSTIIIVASIGFVINGATALLFVSGRRGDLNIRGAFLHMVADAAVSLGVVVAGVAMLLTGWHWIDPAVSLVIAVVILVGTWGLLKASLNLAMDAVPAGIDPQAVKSYLKELPGVQAVHDLHIWGMSTTETALTAHLVKPQTQDDDEIIERASKELHERFGIDHTTLQWERHGVLCPSTGHWERGGI